MLLYSVNDHTVANLHNVPRRRLRPEGNTGPLTQSIDRRMRRRE